MQKPTVKQRMSTNLVTISWNAPISEAAELMAKRSVRHLPVVNEISVIIGIVSDRDVYRAMDPERPGFVTGAVVGGSMSWPVITVGMEQPLSDAAQAMIDEKISAFLVTDASDSVVGILTSHDLLKALVKNLSNPNPLLRAAYSPLVSELLREAQATGL